MSATKALTWEDLNLRSVNSPEELPQKFNFASALLDRHIVEGRGSRPALWGPCGNYTYEQLFKFVNRIGNAMLSLGVERENRVLILAKDSPEWVASHLAAMKIGAVAIGVNTFTHVKDYEYFLSHSRARLLIVDAEYLPQLEPFLWKYNLRAVLVVRGDAPSPIQRFESVVAKQSAELVAADTDRDEASHWVYTSGSTGESKGAVHLHRNTVFAAEPYARHVIRMTPDDIAFSVARLFFSYGLMNSYFMPLWIGASVVLLPDRPEPKPVMEMIEKYKPTLYYSVPTSYGRMMRDDIDLSKLKSIRHCVSAGEALPAPIYEEWRQKTGLEILDGVGSTEVGYIFLSNRPGQVAPGTSGTMIPGHKGRLVDAEGKEVADGEIGELQVSSPAVASYYWRNHEASKRTFLGEWTRTNDQYKKDESGNLVYQGRTDDLFKSGGIWVSPIQVESTLLEHPAIAEASVVAERDTAGLEKPIAYVVLRTGFSGDDAMLQNLKKFTKDKLAAYKCPHAFHFVADLPKTSTGKIQRFKLRAQGAPKA